MVDVAIDFETYLISEKMPVPRPVCLSYYLDVNDKGLAVGNKSMEEILDTLLSRPNVNLIAHNAVFEGQVIYEWFPKLRDKLLKKYVNKQIKCTKINEQLIDNLRKHPIHRFSLDRIVKHYFEEDISADKKDPDAWRLRYSELDGVDLKDWPQEAIDYAIDDSEWAFKVYQEQNKVGLDSSLSVEAEFWLNQMGIFGINIDHNRVLELEAELLDKINPKYEKLKTKGLCSVTKQGKTKKNMKKFREYLSELDIKLEYTAKGAISTSSESIQHYYAECKDEILKDFLDIMKYEKVLTAFISRLKKADPLIRTQYKAVVSSGRTSSSTSVNYPSVNMQQMPREVPGVKWDIRNCFVPRDGYCIVSIDYAGLELASTAHQLGVLTGRRYMLATVNSGLVPKDMHSVLACRIMSIKEKRTVDYDEFVANKKKSPYKEYRQLAKPINLGFPGGIGYDTMRTLLAREGIHPKLEVLETSQYENSLTWKRGMLRKEGWPIRIRRIKHDEYQLIYDELVELKQELFGLYPDLEYFLTDHHTKLLNGETKHMKNEFNEWEEEPLYNYEIPGFIRANCMYTQVCNGLMMQSPAAIGAKTAVCDIARFANTREDINLLAFIHDELLFEVKMDENLEKNIEILSEMMIDSMQKILSTTRIAVEAEAFEYWKKAGGFYSKEYWKNSGQSKLNSV